MNLLSLLSEPRYQSLPRKEFHKDDVLWREGERCRYVCILNGGSIRIQSYTLSGERIVYNELRAGEMFGNNLIFSSSPFYRGDVVGASDGKLILLDRESLLSILREDEPFLLAYLQEQSDFGKSLNAKLKLLSLPSAKERLDFYLSLHEGTVRFRSISALADELYLKRETLSRLVHALAHEGTIILRPHEISLP